MDVDRKDEETVSLGSDSDNAKTQIMTESGVRFRTKMIVDAQVDPPVSSRSGPGKLKPFLVQK